MPLLSHARRTELALPQALLANGTLPRVIAGASAGSIVASIVCTHTDDEMVDAIEVEMTWRIRIWSLNH